ncbi:acyltransferase family protein [Paenibacillus pini]|uniref:Acyltransferase 3 n=1 Tax=Paenibacillus pini JCM 16418 TaxID=1236976 RepID=W7YUB7_9BACL|nr:acyltransferase family protein [Paenibacillus pini]GAF08161.1 acyltransferase 3 [Paenibacillus pini JCM 16418]
MNTKRVGWLDISKGFGMIFVIWGHTLLLPNPLLKFIYTFHMPLFFFISGYLFSSERYPKFKQMLAKKSKTLLLPYLIFSIPSYAWWFLEWKSGEHPDISVIKPILGTFLAIRNTDWTSHTGTLWFVICLFVVEMMYYVIHKKFHHSPSHFMMVIIAIAIAGLLYNLLFAKPLLWNLDAAMIVLPFFGLGHLFKQYQHKLTPYFNYKFLSLFFIMNLITGLLNTKIDIFSGAYGNYILFYVSAISGIFVIIMLSQAIQSQIIVTFIGVNTLVLLVFHPFILAIIRKLIQLPTDVPAYLSLLTSIAYTIVALLISMPVILIINKYFPFVIGKPMTMRKRLKPMHESPSSTILKA